MYSSKANGTNRVTTNPIKTCITPIATQKLFEFWNHLLSNIFSIIERIEKDIVPDSARAAQSVNIKQPQIAQILLLS